MSIQELISASESKPLFVAFLRHTGCTFCREWVTILAKEQDKIRSNGFSLVVVHMSPADEGEQFLSSYGLKEYWAISDPSLALYREFGAKRAKITNLLSLSVWKNVFKKGFAEGYGAGLPAGDGFQLGGFVLISKGKILDSRWSDSIDTPPLFIDLMDNNSKAGRLMLGN